MPDPTDAPVDQVAALEVRVAELERLVIEATTPPAACAAPPPAAEGSVAAAASQAVGRRRALQALGGAAVAGAATVLATQPAAALDGDNVVVGTTKSAQSTTGIVASTAISPVLHVRATNTAFDEYSAAIQGSSHQIAGTGVVGVSTNSNGAGTLGYNAGFLGVGARGVATGSGGRGGSFQGTQAAIRLEPNGSGPTGLSNVNEGDILFNSSEEMWVCVGVAPTTWRLVASPATSNAIRLVTPYRAYDSRAGQPPLGVTKGKLNDGQERDISLASGANPPARSTGALVNLTATNTSASGWLSIFKDGIAWPGTSTVNWSQAGATVANFAIVAMTGTGGVTVRAAGSADVIVDVIGFG